MQKGHTLLIADGIFQLVDCTYTVCHNKCLSGVSMCSHWPKLIYELPYFLCTETFNQIIQMCPCVTPFTCLLSKLSVSLHA